MWKGCRCSTSVWISTKAPSGAPPAQTPPPTQVFLRLSESCLLALRKRARGVTNPAGSALTSRAAAARPRSEEHTSELQSRGHLVCRLLLEKKKNTKSRTTATDVN